LARQASGSMERDEDSAIDLNAFRERKKLG
jgi:hypothetical protein